MQRNAWFAHQTVDGTTTVVSTDKGMVTAVAIDGASHVASEHAGPANASRAYISRGTAVSVKYTASLATGDAGKAASIHTVTSGRTTLQSLGARDPIADTAALGEALHPRPTRTATGTTHAAAGYFIAAITIVARHTMTPTVAATTIARDTDRSTMYAVTAEAVVCAAATIAERCRKTSVFRQRPINCGTVLSRPAVTSVLHTRIREATAHSGVRMTMPTYHTPGTLHGTFTYIAKS